MIKVISTARRFQSIKFLCYHCLCRIPPERVLPFGMKDNFWEMGSLIFTYIVMLLSMIIHTYIHTHRLNVTCMRNSYVDEVNIFLIFEPAISLAFNVQTNRKSSYVNQFYNQILNFSRDYSFH